MKNISVHSIKSALQKRHGGIHRHWLVAVYLGQMSQDPQYSDVIQRYIDGTCNNAEIIDRMEGRYQLAASAK